VKGGEEKKREEKKVKGREEERREEKRRKGKSREKRREQKGRSEEGRREENRKKRREQKRGLYGIDGGVFGEDREDRVRECVAVRTSWGLFGWKCRQKGLLDALLAVISHG